MNAKSTSSTAPERRKAAARAGPLEGLSEEARADAASFESPPRFTREMAEEGRHMVGDVEIRRGRGRPAKAPGDRKEKVTLRLSPDVLAHFRAQGEGWQTRIDGALRRIAFQERAERRFDTNRRTAPEARTVLVEVIGESSGIVLTGDRAGLGEWGVGIDEEANRLIGGGGSDILVGGDLSTTTMLGDDIVVTKSPRGRATRTIGRDAKTGQFVTVGDARRAGADDAGRAKSRRRRKNA